MTEELFRQDATLVECKALVLAVGETSVVLDRTVFYPLGGGQAGDAGCLLLEDGSQLPIIDTRKETGEDGLPTGRICHLVAEDARERLSGLRPGDAVLARIDAERRRRLMRFHTTTHLLCHLVGKPVNGCSITPDYARLDFHMTEPLDKEQLSAGIAHLVAAALPVAIGSVTDAELDANPQLVRSMSVQPPRGAGTVRTIRIGDAGQPVDLQPCGGTHVANTAEIGAVVVTKIEKKSASTRRVVLGFAAP
ncbi:alanyl-tRNA editing protein [Ottowia sp.]|uniref:alanyl-tRNA editing protein n=1 Tax=Ottowia sp. TaxID=1898956 RepID=UPI002CB0609D|nr:alanyl-tRNA editing protein [Ottowia sp.]HRN75948.1 alanyl-tRNA editing protein [Ottowia sp.]HRQ04040.1 alanyl-tRNA editing protein [Ottowia sp.]